VPSGRAKAAAALLLIVAAPAAAQQSTPRQDYEEATGRPKPTPVIPRELRAMVAEATPDRLVVRGVNGQAIPVNIDWIEPAEFTTYQDGRYFGFSIHGYEAGGYMVVDRRGGGEAGVIETGQAPAFSPDGRLFAAVEMSDAGFGNLNGLAVWEVLPERTVRRLFIDALPRAFDWRVDGWVRPDCVAVSAIEAGWQPAEGEDWEQALRNAPRTHYGVAIGEGIVLSPNYERPGCTNEETP
jgi:hypothetical protein